jgi:organic hydroperoxide reductase OsmC/OhrA
VHSSWSGSTGHGYASYSREHTASATPALQPIQLSADPSFRGDKNLLNPEQLVVLAASSCQLLSFLAVCAREHVEVLDYEDDGEGMMSPVQQVIRLASILLKPTIRVAAGTDKDLVLRLVARAHRECYIANSLIAEVHIEPTVVVGMHPS